MQTHRRWPPIAAALLLVAGACGPGDSDYQVKTVFDPCETLVLAVADGASAAQRDAVAAAAQLWNQAAGTRLTLEVEPGAPSIPVVFEEAAPVFYGLYDDVEAIVYLNSVLVDPALTIVAAHELGHSFGLTHVSSRDSVMRSGNLDVPPGPEDVAALEALWGACGPITP